MTFLVCFQVKISVGPLSSPSISSLKPFQPQVTVKDTVSAGDSFTAGLTVDLRSGIDTQKVLENARRVGAFVASHNWSDAIAVAGDRSAI
jgi:sugar/nucleoside kinase (ribokinase family)